MTVTSEERQRIIDEHVLEEKRKLSDKMRALGKKRTRKKIAAARRTVKIAQAARWGKKRPK